VQEHIHHTETRRCINDLSTLERLQSKKLLFVFVHLVTQVRHLKTIFDNFLAEVSERRANGAISIQKSM
jgi:hypothetical protein